MDNNKKRQRKTGKSLLTNSTPQQHAKMLNGQSTQGNIDLGALPANLYFTICDDISNESEFLEISTASGSAHTQIKDEPKSDQLQYRIAQIPKTSVSNTNSSSPAVVTLRAVALDGTRYNANPTPTVGAASILPTTVQLPSGCEIYLVKEYDESENLFSEDCEEPSAERITLPQGVTLNNNSTSVSILPKTSIKSEPGAHTQFLESNVISSKIDNNALKVTTAGSVASNYKKRDEKRRATHNEVERRRRDKINSWIFKLKEMLPTDISAGSLVSKSKLNNVRNCCNCSAPYMKNSGISTSMMDTIEKSQQSQQRGNGNNCRSPNDSKSQILIKACEYIKVMQDEVKSCLMENEKLRTNNQRLQSELQKLKNKEQRHQPSSDTFNNSNNCACPTDDFTLTLCTTGSSNLDDVTSSTIFTATPSSPSTSVSSINTQNTSITVPYAKRELIITDYVD